MHERLKLWKQLFLDGHRLERPGPGAAQVQPVAELVHARLGLIHSYRHIKSFFYENWASLFSIGKIVGGWLMRVALVPMACQLNSSNHLCADKNAADWNERKQTFYA